MKTPSRYYTARNNRHSLKLAVFCNTLGGMFIKETTGTRYEGYIAEKTYRTKQGDGAGSIVAEEYIDCLRAAVSHFMSVPAFRRQATSPMLMHDRSKIHTSKLVTHALQDLQLRAALQPPRSPDLMPLDYGIFGFTKAKQEREEPMHATWGDKVKMFKNLLTNAPTKATINEFPLRLQACIDSRGEHLGDALKALKKARSAGQR